MVDRPVPGMVGEVVEGMGQGAVHRMVHGTVRGPGHQTVQSVVREPVRHPVHGVADQAVEGTVDHVPHQAVHRAVGEMLAGKVGEVLKDLVDQVAHAGVDWRPRLLTSTPRPSRSCSP